MEQQDFLNPVFQVSEFNELVNNHLALLGEVTIEGEITRLDVKNGRLIFASIKDSGSSLDVFSMSHLIKNIRQFEPGMLVRVTGTAGLYKQSSRFRLFASSMMPQGEGSLQIAFEKLKAQLEAEGLFAAERKRPLPQWPTRIGLITAKNSSAYYDLVKILSARMSGLHIKLLPVNVQGREALPTILKAFSYANLHAHEFDVLIMARGGGSMEDLAAFNTEEIARAVFSSKVPIVSAIGHEDNWSLTDFCADVRASTPSNAAELVVRDRIEVVREISATTEFIHQSLLHQIRQQKLKVNEAVSFIHKAVVSIEKSVSLLTSRIRIVHKELEQHLHQSRSNLVRMQSLIQQSIKHKVKLTSQDIDHVSRLLHSLDYQQTLKRGFSITKNAQGQIVKSVQYIEHNEELTTQLADGVIISIARKG